MCSLLRRRLLLRPGLYRCACISKPSRPTMATGQSSRIWGTQRFKVRQPDHRAYQHEMEGLRKRGHPRFPGTAAARDTAGAGLVRRARRLVILGDPGGGKTTLLPMDGHRIPAAFSGTSRRFGNNCPMSTRCRKRGGSRCSSGAATSATRTWPSPASSTSSSQHLYETELKPDEAEVMRAVVLAALARGEALRSSTDSTRSRIRGCGCSSARKSSERLCRYPNAPIVVTSRIVGYRDMPYRMGGAFRALGARRG